MLDYTFVKPIIFEASQEVFYILFLLQHPQGYYLKKIDDQKKIIRNIYGFITYVRNPDKIQKIKDRLFNRKDSEFSNIRLKLREAGLPIFLIFNYSIEESTTHKIEDDRLFKIHLPYTKLKIDALKKQFNPKPDKLGSQLKLNL